MRDSRVSKHSGDWCYCANNSVARTSVIFLKHCHSVSIIDWCDLCGLKCNMMQDPIKVLLHHRPCFSTALLNNIFDQLEVKLASGVHLAVIQALHCRLLKLWNKDTTSLIAASVDAEPICHH
jgi:hypothetical protein